MDDEENEEESERMELHSLSSFNPAKADVVRYSVTVKSSPSRLSMWLGEMTRELTC